MTAARKCNRCGVMKTTADFERGRRVCYRCRNGSSNAIARRIKWQRAAKLKERPQLLSGAKTECLSSN